MGSALLCSTVFQYLLQDAVLLKKANIYTHLNAKRGLGIQLSFRSLHRNVFDLIHFVVAQLLPEQIDIPRLAHYF